MKKKVVIIIATVVVSISIALSCCAIYLGLYAKENIAELYSCYELNWERIENLRSSTIEEEATVPGTEFGSPSETVWTGPIIQGEVISPDGLRLLGSEEVLWTSNMELTAPNYYSVIEGDTGYALVIDTFTSTAYFITVHIG